MIGKLVPIIAAACLLLPSTQAKANYQGCVNQCYQIYETRFNYCYSRHGGNSYEAELCMLGEYEAWMDCLNNCSTTYGFNAKSDKRVPRFVAKQAPCTQNITAIAA